MRVSKCKKKIIFIIINRNGRPGYGLKFESDIGYSERLFVGGCLHGLLLFRSYSVLSPFGSGPDAEHVVHYGARHDRARYAFGEFDSAHLRTTRNGNRLEKKKVINNFGQVLSKCPKEILVREHRLMTEQCWGAQKLYGQTRSPVIR